MNKPKPNILLLFTDQQRWDALACAGGWMRTPHIDQIASEGTLFTQCVTNSPVCVPARISLATGWYPHNTGVWRNGNVTLPKETPTWVRALRDAGYRTSLFGKAHLHSLLDHTDLRRKEHLLRAYGFDDVNEVPGPRGAARIACHMTNEWKERGLWDAYRRDMRARLASKLPVARPSPLDLDSYYDVYVGRKAADYLHDYKNSKPWFCWVGFPGPHEPWDAPEPYASMYDPSEAPEPISYSEECWDRAEKRPRGWLDRRLHERGGHVSSSLGKQLRASYAGNVTLIDDQVGKLIDVVRRRGELDRTVIVFASDHGEMNGDFGMVGKSNMLDPAVRVPLVIRVPGTRSCGTTINCLVELMDLGPTLVELAGGELRHQQFGRSLVPILEDPSLQHRVEAVVELRREVMLYTMSWKMTANARGDPYLLFNRTEDPEERANLAGTYEGQKIEKEMMARLRRRIDETQVNEY